MSAPEPTQSPGAAASAAGSATDAAPAPGVANPARSRRNAGVPIVFFDTTLRDGEQSPGISLNVGEKLEIAHQLVRLGVDVIEGGFPVTSAGDFAAVKEIAAKIEGPAIAALSRAVANDINTAARA